MGDWGWSGVGDRALEFPKGGEQVAVSPSGRARIRFNTTLNRLEQSINGADYIPFAGGAGLAGIVRLDSATYTVQSGDETIVIPGDDIGAAVFVTLPLAITFPGRRITFKNLRLEAATSTTLVPVGSDTMDGGSFTGVVSGDFTAITLQSDGVTDWLVVSSN